MKREKKHIPRKKFEGFTYYEGQPRFTKLPHEWLDEILSQVDNLAEMKVILYIFRHTCGFAGEFDTFKHITIKHFMEGRPKRGGRMDNGTDLSETSVRNGLKKAIEHGYVICETDDNDLARIDNYYKLNLHIIEAPQADYESEV